MSVRTNTIVVEGRIGKDVEIKQVGENTVANTSIAVYRSGKGDDVVTDWFFVEAWHDVARGLASVTKGTMIIVKGVLKANKTDKGTFYTIVANTVGRVVSIRKEDNGTNNEEDPF